MADGRSPRSPEACWLLAAASVAPPAETQQRLRGLPEVDPDRLLRLARAHGLVPLLDRALAEWGPGARAGAAREALRHEARAIARRSVALTASLIGLLDRLARSGVETITFKGPTLALLAYGDVAMRRFADLDLLVPPAQFGGARRVLEDAGFRPHDDEFRAVRERSHELTFDDADGRVQIDLHQRLFSRELAPIRPGRIWSGARPVQLGGRAVRTLGDELLVLVLCEHAHKHAWSRLLWLADLAHLFRARPQLDGRLLLELARESGSRRVVGVASLLAAELLDAPVPPVVLAAAAADRRAGELASRIGARLLDVAPGDEIGRHLELGALQWHGRERLRDRLRFVFTPNEADWIAPRLPGALSPLYWVFRPLRLLATYGFGSMRQLLRSPPAATPEARSEG